MKTFRWILSSLLPTLLLAVPLVAQPSESATSAMNAPRAAAPSEDGRLSEAERAEIVELLERSRRETEELAAQATDATWSAKPGPDRWSPGEVVEHVVLAEEGLLGLARGALGGEEDPEWAAVSEQQTVEGLLGFFQDRSQKFPAPERFQPRGEASREELLARYAAVRTKTLDFVRTTDAPLKRFTAAGPAGKMNVHQWLALIAGHNLRHNLQILEALDQLAAGEGSEASAGG